MMPLIRYPGSKSKLATAIINSMPWGIRGPLFASASKWTYIEPFFGSGAIGFSILGKLQREYPYQPVQLSDKDYGMVALWNAVKDAPEELTAMIREFTPHEDRFYEYKQNDGDTTIDPVVAGFRKLALHQMSISGFGAMSGGPLGGRDQENAKYRVDCRWNPERLMCHVWDCHKVFKAFKLLSIKTLDFEQAIADADSNSFVYLDPPYVEKGGMLYKYSMSEGDHCRLARLLKFAQFHWALSYDDHQMVRDLYAWAEIRELEVTYTNATLNGQGSRPKNREILIQPREPR